MVQKPLWGLVGGLVLVIGLAVLWVGRLQVIHLTRNEFAVVNRITGDVRYCDPTGCFTIAEVSPQTPAPRRAGPYEDLIPKK